MLKLFSSTPKPDSPLADEKERRKIWAEMAAMEAPAAVAEAGDWLEALQAEDGFAAEDRFTILSQIEDAAAPAVRTLTREFFTAKNLPRNKVNDYWRRTGGTWQALGVGYARCLDLAQHDPKAKELAKRNLPNLCLRLVHAHGQWLKWSQFRYGPLDPALWHNAGQGYLAAVQGGFDRALQPVPGGQSQSSVHDEYLRLVALQASSIDRLRSLQIELADRIIGHFIKLLVLSPQPPAGAAWWIDPARPMPAVRLLRPPAASATLRYLSAVDARGRLRELIAALEREILPPDLELGAQYSPKVVLPVLHHLARCWSDAPPRRAHDRHAIRSGLRTVSGLEKVRGQVAGRAGLATESEIEDVSRGGFSVRARAADEDQLRLGAIVGLQPDGGSNWLVGIVRRVARQQDGSLRLGVETLSHKPVAVEADVGGERTQAVLLDELERGATVRLVLPQYAFEDRAVVTLNVEGIFAELEPAGLIETTEDCDLARYRVAKLTALA